MSANKIDAWLVYDYEGMNPTLETITHPLINVTRPAFALVPNSGTPIILVHSVDAGRFNLPGWSVVSYQGHVDLLGKLRHLISPKWTIAMEYSPNARLPRVSRVDAGTIELIRSLTSDIISSADLLQFSTQRWSDKGLEFHQTAGNQLGRIVLEAFEKIGDDLTKGITEYDIAEFIREEFQKNSLWTDAGPVVAVNEHSSDPHFEPTEDVAKRFSPGDWVLIDLWARDPNPDGVFADITWTAFIGDQVPPKIEHVFQIVIQARDLAIEFGHRELSAGRPIFGYQLDQVARAFIERSGYGDFFSHRTGHSLGREVHASGANIDSLETYDTRTLIPGLGFTIEPGIYLPEFGVRSEVDLYVKEDGLQLTSPIQKEVILID